MLKKVASFVRSMSPFEGADGPSVVRAPDGRRSSRVRRSPEKAVGVGVGVRVAAAVVVVDDARGVLAGGAEHEVEQARTAAMATRYRSLFLIGSRLLGVSTRVECRSWTSLG
jgi:hypothetical protein